MPDFLISKKDSDMSWTIISTECFGSAPWNAGWIFFRLRLIMAVWIFWMGWELGSLITPSAGGERGWKQMQLGACLRISTQMDMTVSSPGTTEPVEGGTLQF